MIEAFKNKIKRQATVGMFVMTSDPAFVEIPGYAGMDFAILDAEHGACSFNTLQNLVRAAKCSGILPIIRVPDILPEYIGKSLDIGAEGVQVPNVSNREDAEKAVSLAKFYPDGQRGLCRYARAAEYSSRDKFEYIKQANDTLVVLQIEGMEGVRNFSEIIKVKGIDIIFIGPYDLSQSLGVPGDVENPKVLAEMDKIIQMAGEIGVAVGTLAENIEAAIKLKERGIRYIVHAVDVGVYYQACLKISQAVKG